ncbi:MULTISPECIES: glycosyltransferase family A protein [unclassified Leptolyngbya]|uniref:glycosyltransferase n=1 Tax=unclassified Leptolyngbya TaxID=2650499 RepID=UPI001689DFB1|nr:MULTISPECIES: glycosyltransferase family A protein [unclassified Leptolyngbya]MBD1911830.1 glycosyltransferase family 2 protein [Leptolyngbya sp. FACHB-8]MBD2158933.1 glycosyltransferase family 2 protein [Leptolyngbya sp. FACHB-16]
MPEPFVSVIIPVFNDAEKLKTCLSALAQQTYRPDSYEVIVVDNGSENFEEIEALAAQFPQVVLTQESTPGSYAARNKGISVAKGSIIAFTDSDCIPAPDWLEKGVHCLLEHPHCGLVAGRIDIFYKDSENPTAVELYDGVIMGFPQDEFISKRKAGATANVFTWKHVVDQVGNFKAQMKSHGDMEWGKRVHTAGYELIYADNARIAHPARDSFQQLYKRTIRLVGGMYDMYVTQENSIWKRNKRVVRFIVSDLLLLGIGKNIRKAWQDSRLQRIDLRLKVIGIILIMRYVGMTEKIRLKFGGSAFRG